MTPREEYLALLPLAQAKGSDKKFRLWVNDQRSCISGRWSEWVNGQGKCIAAHYRSVGWGSGTGKKGDYCCVPLTREEHDTQHAEGYEYYAPIEWWQKQVVKYLKMWIAS